MNEGEGNARIISIHCFFRQNGIAEEINSFEELVNRFENSYGEKELHYGIKIKSPLYKAILDTSGAIPLRAGNTGELLAIEIEDFRDSDYVYIRKDLEDKINKIGFLVCYTSIDNKILDYRFNDSNIPKNFTSCSELAKQKKTKLVRQKITKKLSSAGINTQ